MTKSQKVTTYAFGFILGCLILMIIPKKEPDTRRAKWQEQTAPYGYYPYQMTDDYGRELTILKQPRHFISLAPSVTEMLFAMDMGDHVAAVTEWCQYPEEAKNLRDAGAQIGSMNQPNRELIASYLPDLVIGTNFTPIEVYNLIQNPPRTNAIALKHDGMADVLADIETLGLVTGVPGKALELISKLKEQKAQTDARVDPYRTQPALKTLFLLSLEENLIPGWSPGKDSWVGDMINQLNGENVAEKLGQEWGQPSLEALIALNPQVIVIREPESSAELEVLKNRVAQLKNHSVWRQLDALKEDRVYLVSNGPFTIPGPRMFDAYEELSQVMWPEQNKEASKN